MKKLLVVGGASYDSIIYIDDLPEGSGTFFSRDFNETVGSTGVGKALNLGRLGFSTVFHAMIGKDIYGEKVKESFADKKIDFIYDIDPKGTERHTNIIDKDGSRISIYTSYATFEPVIDYSKLEEKVKDSDYLILNIINYARELIPVAKKCNKEIWCDIHDYDGENEYHQDFIESADYLFMSSDSLDNYKEFMEKMINKGKKLVVCTHGKDGATALTKDGEWIEVPIIADYEMLDSNGAGDSFFAGFLYGFSKGYCIERSLRIGTIVAGLCITSYELAYEKLNEDLIEVEYDKYYG
ncbi:carbohydrate kinase family protein [Orenia marismortui]|uniref:carbohydrate kinase family protein n=1 Tax=Orenia marismortui TaxID=46469 RepID=UPI0003601E10|nr:PfkB family carbohydrate kinase [Orenia marismortui]